ncbi:2OG-Fe(II) oxygenase family protein [Rhodospirillaceae bacterium]|nr:2OG-Fe(II) oxygenase family protein [Rhodospirillaceae bacterium]
MHEQGWLSGSVYINVPTKSKAPAGNLVVCIEDDPSISNDRRIIDVVTGSLCLFPASLLHYTIPFESDEERIVLAFDLVPAQ